MKFIIQKIRVISFVFALLLTLSLLVACRGNSFDGTIDTTNQDNVNFSQVDGVKIVENGEVYFKIVYSSMLSDDVKEAVGSVQQTLVQRSNGGVVLVSEADSKDYNAEIPEILIGDTGYPESDHVMESIGYGDWAIRFEGKKLVIAAYSRVALRTALTKTLQTIKNCADENGNITFAEDLNLSGTQDSVINNLPRYTSDSPLFPQTIDEGNETSLALIQNSTIEEYDAYLLKLQNEGYKFYTSNTIGENRFATYINDTYLIHAGWYDYENATRITIEPKIALVGLESDNVWEPISGMVTSLAQVGLDIEAAGNPAGGMGYIWQLADGSYIVIDGGYSGNASQLFDYMKAKAPNGKIVIAAWFITHDDKDHYQAFASFCANYKNEVCVESVVLNFPSAFLAAESGFDLEMGTFNIAKELPNCKVIKVHTGMKFFLRNAEIEILFTIDSKVPSPVLTCNNSSLVFTVTIEGERVMFTADMANDAAGILVSMYGNYLKSDMLQIAHHGETNGSGKNPTNMRKFYQYVCSEMTLWPCSESCYLNTVGGYGMNQVAMQSAREVWVAGGEKITVFEMPYSPFSAYQFDPNNPHPVSVAKGTSSDHANLFWNLGAGDEMINHVDWNENE